MEAQSGRSSIFILDSDPFRADKLVRYFESAGGVHESSPANAFKAIMQQRPRLLVARMSLVAGKDFAFLRALRRNSATAGLPVLVVANKDESALIQAAQQAGATQVLVGADVQAAIDAACELLPQGPCPDDYEEKSPDSLKDLYARACRRIRNERYVEAAADLKAILQKKPHAPEVLVSLAVALRHMGKRDAAVKSLNRAALLFAATGKDAKAKDIYEQLSKSDPAAKNPYMVLAERKIEEDRPFQAMKLYERAADLWPRDIRIKTRLVEVYEDLARTDLKYESLAAVLRMEVNALRGISSDHEEKEWLEDEDETLGDGAMQFVDEVSESKTPEERRRSPRVPLVTHSLSLDKHKDPLPAVDVSMTGIGFKPLDEKFEVGQVFHFDLLSMGEVQIKKLTARVMRVTRGVVGAQFEKLSSRQSKRLQDLCES
ncbi:PilZ domain-containing protein [Oceanidesulfovibrio indonesiensis]|nr:PilZ domain-containing protein [Oceanidesulfovibrio indonesiensis]